MKSIYENLKKTNSTKFCSYDYERYKVNINPTTKLSDHVLEDGVLFLAKQLGRHFDRKVYILIDEYDAPLNSTMQYCSNEDIILVSNLYVMTGK